MVVIHSMLELGSIVKRQRVSLGMTQTQLANVSNVGLSYITNLEHGKATTEAGKMINVLTSLGIDIQLSARDGSL